MPNEIRYFLDFGEFTFDLTNNVLLRGGNRVPLAPLALAVLRYLIEQRDRCISKDELLRNVWKGEVVENAVYQQISQIYAALGDAAHELVENRPKIGWQFIGVVTERTEVSQTAVAANLDSSMAGDCQPLASLVIAESVHVSPMSSYSATPSTGNGALRTSLQILPIAIAIALGTAALTLALTRKPEARVLNSTQLTRDGREKSGPLFSDGQQIFFREWFEGRWQIVGIPTSGGDASSLNVPLTNASLQDISRDGSTLLLQSYEADVSKLWAYTISRRILQPVGTGLNHGPWAFQGRMLAAEAAGEPSILISSGSAQRKIDLPGVPWSVKWSPDGTKLRFSLLDPKRESSAIWEIDNGGTRPHRLAWASAGNKFAENGVWDPDGKYFFYAAGTPWHQDIWASRESAGPFRFGRQRPVRLTSGEPGSWTWPSASSDESTVFALNQSARSELVRFNKSTSRWEPEWGGAAAYELDYSRDGNWVTYTHFPDHTIWKARPNGNARLRLTEAGSEGHQPHWSPDGTQIAYMGKDKRGEWRIFRVSANGGMPQELLPVGEEQAVPTWSPDGGYLLFGDLLGRKPKTEMSIHLLDLPTRRVDELRSSKGLWSPRWSPNGRYVAAITSDSEAIRVLPWTETQWHELVRMKFVDNATWSLDSRYVYFNGHDDAFHMRLFRVAVPNGRLEQLADLTDFPDIPENWFGVGPEGTPLAFRGVDAQEIFALKCVLP